MQKLSLRVVGKGDLLGNRQFEIASCRIHRFMERNALDFEVFSRAAQRSLLAHHVGHAVGLLTRGPLLLARLLPVFQTVQPLIQSFTNALIQWVTRYRLARGPSSEFAQGGDFLTLFE